MSRIQSSSRDVQITVSLSKLTASRRNPRRVKPESRCPSPVGA